jgi:hypothetical protein
MSESRTVFDEFFPHRVCINLDRRPERWEKMQTRLEAAGLGAVDRFPAVRSVTMNWKCSLLPISPSFGEQTHAVHLWNEMWRRGGRDKRIVHGPGCLYERLKQAYGFASVIAS